jgi:hypothetical protein
VLPDSLMHEQVGLLRGQDVSAQECFSFQTSKNPRGGGLGDSGRLIGAPRAQAKDSLDIHSFVRAVYVHGMPLDRAAQFGPENVPVLLRMLEDLSEQQHAQNVLLVLGMIGDEHSAAAIARYARTRPQAPRELWEHQALTGLDWPEAADAHRPGSRSARPPARRGPEHRECARHRSGHRRPVDGDRRRGRAAHLSDSGG